MRQVSCESIYVKFKTTNLVQTNTDNWTCDHHWHQLPGHRQQFYGTIASDYNNNNNNKNIFISDIKSIVKKK